MDHTLKNSCLALSLSYNYYKWQYDTIQKYMGDCVLEIGCGVGNLTKLLFRDSKYLLSVDIKQEAVDYTRQRIPDQKNFHIDCLDVFTDGLKQYSKISFDTIVFSNVLEHIQDDLNALRVCYKILHHSHGTLILLVPAHMSLYGTIDKEVGHFRRYEKSNIIRLARQSKFKIIDLFQFNFLGALGWYLNYCLLKRRNTNNTPTTMQLSLYDKWLVAPSRFIESMIRPVFGLSYIAILEADK